MNLIVSLVSRTRRTSNEDAERVGSRLATLEICGRRK